MVSALDLIGIGLAVLAGAFVVGLIRLVALWVRTGEAE